MKTIKLFFLLITFSFFNQLGFAQGAITPIASFGSNPGNLNMYTYVPAGISGNAPMVMVLHGCTQTAQQASDQTGWNKLANAYKFYVVYPEQKSANNSSNCFNWFESADQEKDQGEDMSLREMIDYMKVNYNIDTTKIFATGLSAGAAMTSVLCATYPEIFNAGAIMSGGPYKAATNATEAYYAMQGTVTNTPSTWANLVFAENPGYTGSYPRIAIFHGTSDPVVNINNATELMKQWTAVHGNDQTAESIINPYAGNAYVTYSAYHDGQTNDVVRSYIISGFGHAIALDTGTCIQQGGQTATYAYDINFHSTWEAAHFFGLIDTTSETLIITGPSAVTLSQTNVSYSVTPSNGSTYYWTVPAGATIISGQGTSSVTINFGSSSGIITVCALDNSSCFIGPEELPVSVGGITGIKTKTVNGNLYYDAPNRKIHYNNQEPCSLQLFDILGNKILNAEISESTGTIDIPTSVAAGTYLIHIYNSRSKLVKKIVVY